MLDILVIKDIKDKLVPIRKAILFQPKAYQNGYPDNNCQNSFMSSVTLSLTCSTDRVDLPAQMP
jgi:hypothetical protein